MALCSQRPCMPGSAPGGGPTSCLLLSGRHGWARGPGGSSPGLSAPRASCLPEASGRLREAPCGLAQAPRLAAVHSLCREIVLLGTLSLWKNTSSDCKLSLTRRCLFMETLRLKRGFCQPFSALSQTGDARDA